MRAFDVAVIGLGVIGAAVASDCADRGLSVLGVDQFTPPHDRGSSHGETRLIRVAYAEGGAYVPLARRAVALWKTLEARTGTSILHQDGLLYIGAPQTALLTGVRRSASAHAVEVEQLDPRDTPFVCDDAWEILLEPGAGFLSAEPAVEAMLAAARGAGAHLRLGEQARISRSANASPGAGFTITAGADAFTTQKLIICAGSWLQGLATSLFDTRHAPVWIERRALHWFGAGPAFTRAAGFRPFVIAAADDAWIYGFPSLDGARLKAANHFGGARIAAPEAVDAPVDVSDAAAVEMVAAGALPTLGARIASKHCLYTMTPDGDFLVGSPPSAPDIFLAGGMSGHGFKFAPAIGEAAGCWASGAKSPVDVSMFSPARFSAG